MTNNVRKEFFGIRKITLDESLENLEVTFDGEQRVQPFAEYLAGCLRDYLSLKGAEVQLTRGGHNLVGGFISTRPNKYEIVGYLSSESSVLAEAVSSAIDERVKFSILPNRTSLVLLGEDYTRSVFKIIADDMS